MEKKVLIFYDLKRVLTRCDKEFGIIKKGTEDDYNPQLDILEHYIYNIYEQFSITDMSLLNIIPYVIYDLKSHIDDREYDYSEILSESEVKALTMLESSFNPYKSEKLKKVLKNIDLENKDDLKKLFTLPIICLRRIYDSVLYWHEVYGKNGYFKMLEEMVLPIMQIGYHPYIIEDKYIKYDESDTFPKIKD